MDQIFDRPIFPLFDAPWVGGLPYMLETCRGGPGPISLSVEKTKKFWSSLTTPVLLAKMDQIFYRPIFPLFDEPWVGGLPYMLETCRGGPGPISLSVEKTKNFDQVRQPTILLAQMDPIFDRPIFPLFEAPWVGGLPYMLETCRGGPGPIILSVEKTKNFDQVRPPRSCWPNWKKSLIGLFSHYLMPLE